MPSLPGSRPTMWMSAIDAFLLPTTRMSVSTSAMPMPAQSSPPEKPSEPNTISTTMPITSVARSATTMGAVLVMGTPCVTNPERNVRKLSSFGMPRISRRDR